MVISIALLTQEDLVDLALEHVLARVHAVHDGAEAANHAGLAEDIPDVSLVSLQLVHPGGYAFNSFFRLVRKRQSAPCAMILFGVDLSIPASRRRKA